MLHAKLGQTAG